MVARRSFRASHPAKTAKGTTAHAVVALSTIRWANRYGDWTIDRSPVMPVAARPKTFSMIRPSVTIANRSSEPPAIAT
jgi:hypothetical protein